MFWEKIWPFKRKVMEGTARNLSAFSSLERSSEGVYDYQKVVGNFSSMINELVLEIQNCSVDEKLEQVEILKEKLSSAFLNLFDNLKKDVSASENEIFDSKVLDGIKNLLDGLAIKIDNSQQQNFGDNILYGKFQEIKDMLWDYKKRINEYQGILGKA